MNHQQGPVRRKLSVVPPAHDAAEEGTKQRLLNAAERLIADEGAGVSMRRINAEAGAKNLSAVHYHFGSMEAVIRGVIDMRMPAINSRRLEMLSELSQAQRRQLPQVVHTVVWPLAEQLLSSTPPNFYVRFLDAFNQSPNYDAWSTIARKHRRGLTQAYMLIRRAIPDVPPDILHVRIMLGSREMVQTLAAVDRVILERHADRRDRLVLFHASDLVTRLVASLSAPVSDVTLAARAMVMSGPRPQSAMLFVPDSMWRVGGKSRALLKEMPDRSAKS